MTSNIEKYCTALSTESPCGENMEYDPRFLTLQELAEGTPERQMGDSIIPPTEPDWKTLSKTTHILMTQTRDLRIAVFHTAALLATSGFQGLLDGLSIIDKLCADFWDELWPIPDDGDVQERISSLIFLSPMPAGFDANMSVLHLIKDQALCHSQSLGSYCLRDIQMGTIDTKLIRAAFLDTPQEVLQSTRELIQKIKETLKSIRECFISHQQGTPDFQLLIDTCNEIISCYNSNSSDSAQLSTESESSTVEYPDASQTQVTTSVSYHNSSGGSDLIESRQDASRLLMKVCAYFEAYEPSSPVPYFLKRAIRSIGLNFMDLVADIAPNMQEQAKIILKPIDAISTEPLPEQSSGNPTTSKTPIQKPTEEKDFFNPFG
ncbi:MAG: type VI secretion system protein TssA [Akkermansia sp.]